MSPAKRRGMTAKIMFTALAVALAACAPQGSSAVDDAQTFKTSNLAETPPPDAMNGTCTPAGDPGTISAWFYDTQHNPIEDLLVKAYALTDDESATLSLTAGNTDADGMFFTSSFPCEKAIVVGELDGVRIYQGLWILTAGSVSRTVDFPD
jgi:hypothetical protein